MTRQFIQWAIQLLTVLIIVGLLTGAWWELAAGVVVVFHVALYAWYRHRPRPADRPYRPGGCLRCGRSARRVKMHTTYHGDLGQSGCFPLCERCWGLLTSVERLPYYRALWKRWAEDAEGGWSLDLIDRWTEIRFAVMEGR